MKYIGNYKELVSNFDNIDLKLLNLPEQRQTSMCNILEFEPGKIEYAHVDNFLSTANNPVKYLMFLNDWEIGHILTYNGDMLADYKVGDLYQLTDSTLTYCYANIGYTSSTILEIKLYDKEQL
jgi:hypothetical protein